MNTEHYRCLVFDWDGTLIDSIDRIVCSLQLAARRACGRDIAHQACRDVIGMGLMDALATLLPGVDAAGLKRAADAYRQDYLYDSRVPCELFPGVRELLDEFSSRGFIMAVATGKSRLGLDRSLAENDLGHYFAATRCAGEYPSKPEPDMLLSILDDFNVAPQHAMMIGDSEHDMRMARNAGVDAIAVTHGAHDAATLQGFEPLLLLDDIRALSGVLSHTCQHIDQSTA